MAKVNIGDNEVTLQEFSGRKALRVARILREISKNVPEILQEMTTFTRQYEQDNVIYLTRAEALYRLGAERLAHLTDEDWARSDNQLPMRPSPSFQEQVAAVFPVAMDFAEEQVLQLLALCLVSNEQLAKAHRDGGSDAITTLLNEKADELLDDAMGDQLLELAVVASEQVEEQFSSKLRDLGGRVGNLARLFGMGTRSQTPAPSQEGAPSSPSSSSTPDSSTGSPPPTDGESETPSTTPGSGSSSRLAPA